MRQIKRCIIAQKMKAGLSSQCEYGQLNRDASGFAKSVTKPNNQSRLKYRGEL